MLPSEHPAIDYISFPDSLEIETPAAERKAARRGGLGQAFPKGPPAPPKPGAALLGLPPGQESQNSRKDGTSPQTGDDGLLSTRLSSF